jgi:hypothetical protein
VVVRLPGVESAVVIVGEGRPTPMERDGDVFRTAPLDPADGSIKVAIGSAEGWRGLLVYPPQQ